MGSRFGTCGIIIQAHRKGSIAKGEALRILDELLRAGFRMDPTVYRRMLIEIGSPRSP
ncbi:MAG: DUF3368 domain-containing protein [Candidatus Bathyarchaeia archaeon]